MPGLVPGIHVFLHCKTKTWMAGSPNAKTRFALFLGVAGLRAEGQHIRMEQRQPKPADRHASVETLVWPLAALDRRRVGGARRVEEPVMKFATRYHSERR